MNFYHLGYIKPEELEVMDVLAPVLMHFRDNWADEMNVDAWNVQTVDEYRAWAAQFDSDQPLSHYIGSNQEIDYASAREVLDNIHLYHLTPAQARVLQEVFPHGQGDFPEPPYEDD